MGLVMASMYIPVCIMGYVTYGDSIRDSIINSVQQLWIQQAINMFITLHCILSLYALSPTPVNCIFWHFRTIVFNPIMQEAEEIFHVPQCNINLISLLLPLNCKNYVVILRFLHKTSGSANFCDGADSFLRGNLPHLRPPARPSGWLHNDAHVAGVPLPLLPLPDQWKCKEHQSSAYHQTRPGQPTGGQRGAGIPAQPF